jgi:hypothetical protein
VQPLPTGGDPARRGAAANHADAFAGWLTSIEIKPTIPAWATSAPVSRFHFSRTRKRANAMLSSPPCQGAETPPSHGRRLPGLHSRNRWSNSMDRSSASGVAWRLRTSGRRSAERRTEPEAAWAPPPAQSNRSNPALPNGTMERAGRSISSGNFARRVPAIRPPP